MRKLALLAILWTLLLAAPAAIGDSHEGNAAGNETASANATNATAENGTAPAAAASAGGNASEGPVLDEHVPLSELGYAECDEGQSVPKAVADGVGGGPSVIDYVETLCRAPAEAQAATGGALDLGAWIIIGLAVFIVVGIALAIYVRRAYTP